MNIKITYPICYLILLATTSPFTLASDFPDDINAIIAAYQQAVEDKMYATRIQPFVHPTLQKNNVKNVLLKDNPAAKDDKKKEISVSLEPLTDQDQQRLAGYFDFPVPATHNLKFQINFPELKEGITSTSGNLLLHQEETQWYVVYGVLKQQKKTKPFDFVEKAQGLWRYNWRLQFADKSFDDFKIVLRDTQENTEIATFLSSKEASFNSQERVIHFRLHAKGSEHFFEASATGGVTLSYAWQVGNKAVSDWLTLPKISAINNYQPITNLTGKLEAMDSLPLAMFDGIRAGAKTRFRIELQRNQP